MPRHARAGLRMTAHASELGHDRRRHEAAAGICSSVRQGCGGPCVPLHEVDVEAPEALDETCEARLWREDRRPEVEGAVLLPEGGPRGGRDVGVLEELQAVQHVRGLPQPSCLRHGPGGHLDAREGVHGPVHRLARDARDGVERLAHGPRAALQGAQQRGALPRVRLVGGLPGPRRVHVAAHGHHTRHGGAEVDARQLVEVSAHGLLDVEQVHVTSADAALAGGAFGHGVEADELLIEGVRGTHRGDHLVAGREGHAPVDVLLVDLVGQDDQTVAVGEANQLLEMLLPEALACRVAGVDDHHRAHLDTLRAGRVQRRLQALHAQTPAGVLVQVVAHEPAAVEGDGGRVQRVLRQGHEDAVMLAAEQSFQEQPHALRGAVREEDVVGARAEAPVTAGDEVADLLADDAVAPRVLIGAQAPVQR
mmetsp:Transcript_58737/g.182165  ORF Transcript_58737/g.182165 Transcript_58737/m.182165 type:complete len:422 (+) Transcript_58737:55-1320(+)